MKEITSQIETAANSLEAQVAALKKGKLADALRFYFHTSEDYEALDKQRKRLFALTEELSRVTIPEMMAEEDVRTVTLDDIGYRFTVSQRYSASLPDKEVGMQWLRDNGHGGLISETVNSSSLAAFAKDLLVNQGIEIDPTIIKVSTMAYTSCTKAK